MIVFLLIVAAFVVWTVRAYFWPMGPCMRCGGSGRNKGSTRKRFGSCGRCGGSGKRQVIGSRTVHRAVRSVVAYRRKDREK